MWFEFEVGKEGGQHFLILPVELHVVEFGIEADGGEESVEGVSVEEEGVSAEAT